MPKILLFLLLSIANIGAVAAESKDFGVARRLFLRDNAKSFATQALKIPADSIYAPLLNYWQAVLALRRQKPTVLAAFAQKTTSTFLREKAVQQLAIYYAENAKWEEFVQLDKLPPCGRLLLHLRNGGSKQGIRDAWRNDARMNDALCIAAYRQAMKSGVLNKKDVWVKMRELAGSKELSATKRLLRHFPINISYQQVRKVANYAVRYIRGKHSLNTQAQRSLVMIAAKSAARSRPSIAIARWKAFSPYFNKEENAQVWLSIAEWAARWHRQDALLLYRLASSKAVYDSNARAWRVRAALYAGDYAEVAATIDAMSDNEKQLSAWRYWRAVAEQETGDIQQGQMLMRALAASEDDYYGLLAREEIAAPLITSQNTASPTTLLPSGDFALALAVRKAGEIALARQIWHHAVRAETENSILLAASREAAAADWYLASIDAANQVPQAHDLRFPLPYHDVITKNSDKFNLDLAFVYGLIRQESRFMPRIVSPAKAHGLMQVLPATARRVAQRHGYNRYHRSRLTRVGTNVIIGATYLADLAKQFKAHPVQVAAAYNAGPARAVRWNKRNRGRDLLIYIENIPILETRLYVKYVLANRAHYEARLGTTRTSMRELIYLPIRK